MAGAAAAAAAGAGGKGAVGGAGVQPHAPACVIETISTTQNMTGSSEQQQEGMAAPARAASAASPHVSGGVQQPQVVGSAGAVTPGPVTPVTHTGSTIQINIPGPAAAPAAAARGGAGSGGPAAAGSWLLSAWGSGNFVVKIGDFGLAGEHAAGVPGSCGPWMVAQVYVYVAKRAPACTCHLLHPLRMMTVTYALTKSSQPSHHVLNLLLSCPACSACQCPGILAWQQLRWRSSSVTRCRHTPGCHCPTHQQHYKQHGHHP
jgi:hypothetical protein